MSSKTERLFNLIALLLDTERPLTVAEIRRKFPEYQAQTDDTFHRTFERDKAEIRELGLALEQIEVDALANESGYRIRQTEALLDDPGFSPDEVAALSIAMQAWSGSAGRDASLGMLKLAAVSGVAEPAAPGWVLPRVSVDAMVTALMDAVNRRKRVRFRYRTGGGGDAQERTVEPYGLYHRGTWYLTGLDVDKDAERHFKLTRVDGAITVVSPGREPDFEAPARADIEVMRGPWEGGAPRTQARLAFAPEVAWWTERRTGARRVADREDGWVEMEVPVADVELFAGWIAGFGERALALEPEELRDAVIAKLRETAEGGA